MTAHVEHTNDTWQGRDDIMGWTIDPNGTRVRFWCLACREAGQEWTTPTPCEHILHARGEQSITTQDALKIRQGLIDEYYQNPSESPSQSRGQTSPHPEGRPLRSTPHQTGIPDYPNA